MASALLAVGGTILAYHKVWKPHVRPHLERIKEIHEHIGVMRTLTEEMHHNVVKAEGTT